MKKSGNPLPTQLGKKNYFSTMKTTSRYALNNLYLDRDQIDTLVATYALSRGYRYGFNGMEKDDEVAGKGNSYTAEFWQYDSRLGRRWNIDPVVKPHRSPYDAFSNNPIIMIDPKGDDDFFDVYGNFLGSSTEGNTIRIVNAGETFEAVQNNIPLGTKLLTDFNYSISESSNRTMLLAIANFYAPMAELENGEIGVGDSERGGPGKAAAVYRSKEDKIYVLVNSVSGLINRTLDDGQNFINVLVHEKYHRMDEKSHFAIDHIYAVIYQTTHSSWENTTDAHKFGAVKYAVSLLNEALEEGADIMEINRRIDDLNKSPLGTVGEFYYDETEGAVNAIKSFGDMEIKANKSE